MSEQGIVDVTKLDNCGYRKHAIEGTDAAMVQRAAIAADRIELKVGTFAADLNNVGFGKVTLGGKPLQCRAFTIRCVAGEPPVIEAEIFLM